MEERAYQVTMQQCNSIAGSMWVFLSLAASIHYQLCQGGLIYIRTWSQFGINSKGGCLDLLYDCGGNIYIYIYIYIYTANWNHGMAWE